MIISFCSQYGRNQITLIKFYVDMPIAKHEFITNVFGEKGLGPVASRPVKKACGFVGSMTIQCLPNNCEGVIDWLGAASEKQDEPELESIRTEIEEELKENN
jgi:hypothetical protein